MFKLKTKSGANNITGGRLAALRHRKGISQRQLARMMQLAGFDVDHHFIRRIENGERFVTDIELVALSRVLSVRIDELIDASVPIADSESE
ncbi:MAG: helix-turn-helix transcriptional regulator [Oscillospiraceae bacterium]|nr:helix-turn-helix transcriptional regulator [Oscillospiraceae bacterium]MBR4201890.1 helix-turn-helix transcriptional regulator [Oscillospiraceae bacterium]MBR6716757.1 helix-turn-helix transcriptional regulator [Oscillospiraceae bacterium]